MSLVPIHSICALFRARFASTMMLAVVAAFALLQPEPSWTQDLPEKIIAAVPANWPPQYLTDPDTGKPTGFAVDFMDEVARLSGLKIRYQVFASWSEVHQAVMDGRALIVPDLGITDERGKDYDFTIPIESEHLRIFVRAGNSDILGIDSLVERKVGVVEFNKGRQLMDARGESEIIVFNSFEEVFLALLSGNVDALVYPEDPAWMMARIAGLETRFKTVGPSLLEVKRGIAVRKGHPELLQVLNAAVRNLELSPKYREIYAKWFTPPDPYWNVRRVFTLMGGLLAFCVVFLVAWRHAAISRMNKSLRTSISEREQAERALGKNQQLLQGIMDHSPARIFIKDLEGRYLLCNRSFERAFDSSDIPIVGRDDYDLFPREIAEAFRINDRRVMESGTPFEIEETESHGGRLHTSIVHKFPLSDETGIPYALCGIATDITERKRVEEALRKSQSQLRAIFQNVAVGIAVVNSEGRYLEINEKWGEMLGYSKEEMIGREFGDMTFPADLEESRRRFSAMTANRVGGFRFEKRYLRKDGSVFWADLSVTRILDSAGRTEAFIGVILDITRAKKIEEQLIKANSELESFAYTVSHDLRSPLTAILGFSEFLQNNYKDTSGDQVADCLGEIQKGGRKMLSLLEDLLTLAKVGKLDPPDQPTDANRVVQDVLAELSERYAEVAKAVRCAVLPEILVSDTLLFQIFVNLIGNALLYAGNSAQAIEVGGERSGRRVTYFVRDYGPGIPAEERSRIFEVFYRGTGSRQLKGTGIGLAIVHKIALFHRGRAWVEETPGGGSTFIVELCEDEPKKSES